MNVFPSKDRNRSAPVNNNFISRSYFYQATVKRTDVTRVQTYIKAEVQGLRFSLVLSPNSFSLILHDAIAVYNVKTTKDNINTKYRYAT